MTDAAAERLLLKVLEHQRLRRERARAMSAAYVASDETSEKPWPYAELAALRAQVEEADHQVQVAAEAILDAPGVPDAVAAARTALHEACVDLLRRETDLEGAKRALHALGRSMDCRVNKEREGGVREAELCHGVAWRTHQAALRRAVDATLAARESPTAPAAPTAASPASTEGSQS